MSGGAARRRRVLIVEDYEPVAVATARLLRLAGHDVRTVLSADEALDAALELRAEVILLDIGLEGGVDGLTLARRLRAEPRLAGVVLVALTGQSGKEAVERIAAAGFDHRLLKPASLEALEAIISGSEAPGTQERRSEHGSAPPPPPRRPWREERAEGPPGL